MESGSCMLEHTLVMSGECLDEDMVWQGWPCRSQTTAQKYKRDLHKQLSKHRDVRLTLENHNRQGCESNCYGISNCCCSCCDIEADSSKQLAVRSVNKLDAQVEFTKAQPTYIVGTANPMTAVQRLSTQPVTTHLVASRVEDRRQGSSSSLSFRSAISGELVRESRAASVPKKDDVVKSTNNSV